MTNNSLQRVFNVLLLIVLSMSCAHAAIEPTLYVSFDNGYSGLRADKTEVDGKIVRFPELVTGKYGKALKAGPLSGAVDFTAGGILSTKQGTIEMWVSPQDWSFSDGKFHVFFQMISDGALYLYKYLEWPKLLMLSTENAKKGPYYRIAKTTNWNIKEWYHIAGTWSEEGVQLYINGVPVSSNPLEAKLPKTLGDTFRIGDESWSSIRTSSSLIDEVRVYDQALTAKDIAQHAKNIFQEVLEITEAGSVLTYDMSLNDKIIKTKLITDGENNPEGYTVDFELRKYGSSTTTEIATDTIQDRIATTNLTLPITQPGNYTIYARLKNNGVVKFTKSVDLTVPDLSWLTQPESLPVVKYENKLLSPPSYVNGQINVWNRIYKVSTSGFPSQITSSGTDLLTAPIELSMVANGQIDALKPLLRGVYPSEDGQMITMSSSLSSTNGNSINLEVTTDVYPDGLMWFTIKPGSGARPELIDSLSLKIPVKSDAAKFRHAWDKALGKKLGSFDSDAGTVDSVSFIPYYWLGNDKAGLYFVAESDKGWSNSGNGDSIVVTKSDTTTTLLLNFKKAGQGVAPEPVIAFGIQATPVKPLPSNWRSRTIKPVSGYQYTPLWPNARDDSFKYYGFPEAKNPSLFLDNINAIRKTDSDDVLPYICPTFLSTAVPEWQYFREKWNMGIIDGGSADVQAYGAAFALVSPRGDGWKQFIRSKVSKFVDDFAINALYFDNVQPHGSYAPSAGVGYERNGIQQNEFPIKGFRDVYEAVRAELSAKSTNAFTVAHVSGNIVMPMISSIDAYVGGEEFRGRVKDNYLDIVPIDYFRVGFNPSQWGAIPIFLPEFDSATALKIEPTRGLMALLLIHDIPVWPQWCNLTEVNRAIGLLNKFGYSGAEFHPYFENTPPASTVPAGLYVSGYKKENNDWLLILGNPGRTAISGKVCLNTGKINSSGPLQNLATDESISLDANKCLAVGVEGMNYQLMTLHSN